MFFGLPSMKVLWKQWQWRWTIWSRKMITIGEQRNVFAWIWKTTQNLCFTIKVNERCRFENTSHGNRVHGINTKKCENEKKNQSMSQISMGVRKRKLIICGVLAVVFIISGWRLCRWTRQRSPVIAMVAKIVPREMRMTIRPGGWTVHDGKKVEHDIYRSNLEFWVSMRTRQGIRAWLSIKGRVHRSRTAAII